MTTRIEADTPAVPTTQYFDPLAIMVGEFARDFVAPERRMDAIDRLYVLLSEARSTPAEALDVPVLSDRGALEQACIAVVGPWFDESHEKGRFTPMELAQRILREYDRRSTESDQ